MNALPQIQAPTNPHYERLGGEAAVQALVEAFYAAMDTREDARAIRAMHPANLAHTKAVLFNYFSEWLGGPRRYSSERGQPRLRHAHLAFAIDAAAARAWLACMQQALQAVCADAALREELGRSFEKIALHLQNTYDPINPRST